MLREGFLFSGKLLVFTLMEHPLQMYFPMSSKNHRSPECDLFSVMEGPGVLHLPWLCCFSVTSYRSASWVFLTEPRRSFTFCGNSQSLNKK